MSQCVPSWDLDDSPPARLPLRSTRSHSIAPHDVPAFLDNEVAELTWENGQIAMHGLGPRRVPNKPLTNTTSTSATTTTNSHACKYAAVASIPTAPSGWDKPHAGGTLESIVNQATRSSFPHKSSPSSATAAADELVPWFDRHSTAATMATNNMDAQVPCSNRPHHQNDVASRRSAARAAAAAGGVNVGSFTQVASCSGAAKRDDINNAAAQQMKLARAAAARVAQEWSVSGKSGSQQVRMDHQCSCERDFDVAYASTSLGSPEEASSGKPSTKAAAAATAADDHDSVCHSRLQASD